MKAIARLVRMTDLFLILAAIFYALPGQAGQPAIIVFDPPGSTGTNPNDINPAGDVVGSYTDANHVARGFLRTADGAIVTFAYPNCIGAQFGPATFINPAGVITGNCVDAGFASRGFVPMGPSRQWTPWAQRAQQSLASIRRAWSRDLTMMRILSLTASCALPAAL